MGRRKHEEWEEEDEEEETTTVDDDPISRHEDTIRFLMNKRMEFDPLSEEWSKFTDLIEAEESALEKAESGRTERAQREDMHRHRFDTIAQIASSCGTQVLIEGIKSVFNRKNVKTITKYEDDGEIVKSAAQKLINSR